MARSHQVKVHPLPTWLNRLRFLGDGDWIETPCQHGTSATAVLQTDQAADLGARLRNVGLNGHPIEIGVQPPLKRAAVRAARTLDARRRRGTTPGFEHPQARSHPEGRIGLTPESLALQMAQGTQGKTVYDACCGVGGNAMAFARSGATVFAVEKRPDLLQLAQENAGVFGVNNRIVFRQGDTLVHSPKAADICFVDPPWGVDWNRVRCTVPEFPLANTLWERFRQTPTWNEYWLKAPSSFEPNSLGAPAQVTALFGHAPGDRRRIKFLLIKVARSDLKPLP